jgi:hypothetical protein
MLVWYSQEARAYVLLVLLAAVTLYYFVRYLREPRPVWLAGWGIASALALLTHYFAGFVIAAEVIVLLVRGPSRRLMLLACAPVVLTGLALLPTVLQQKQTGKADWIGRLGRGGRIKDTAQEFLLGPGKDAFAHASAVAALLCLVAVAFLFARGAEATRRAVVPVAAVAALTLLLPLLVAFAGSDYVFARNMLPALVPLLVVVAAGLAVARRAAVGIALAVALCGLSIAVNVAVATRPELQRHDSRGAAADLGTPDTDRVIVLNPGAQAALGVYMPRLRFLPPEATANASEVDFVAIGRPLPVVQPPPPGPGFRLVEERSEPTYRLQRWRSDQPAALSVAALRSIALLRGGPPSSTLMLFQPRATR